MSGWEPCQFTHLIEVWSLYRLPEFDAVLRARHVLASVRVRGAQVQSPPAGPLIFHAVFPPEQRGSPGADLPVELVAAQGRRTEVITIEEPWNVYRLASDPPLELRTRVTVGGVFVLDGHHDPLGQPMMTVRAQMQQDLPDILDPD